VDVESVAHLHKAYCNIAQMLTTRDVFRFWIPLCATWLMMGAEGPVLTSIIARLADPTLNLAAYGVAIAVGMLIESPVIHLLSTTVALARDKHSLEELQKYTLKVNVLVTVGMVVVVMPPFYNLMAISILRLPADIATPMHWALIGMIPFPAAVGFRRSIQGVLIRYGHTRLVAMGTIVRFAAMAGSALLLVLTNSLPGALIGTLGLSSGVVAEAFTTRFMARKVIATMHNEPLAGVPTRQPLTQRDIFRFHLPLAMTSLISFAVMPMLTIFMNRAPLPIMSLAVLPVVDSLVFLFRSFGFSYQEVGIALMGEKRENEAVIRRVGWYIAAGTTALLAVLTFTPLLDLVYRHMYGLTEELAAFAVLPTQLLIVLPTVAVMYSVQRSILITSRRNVAVTMSTVTEVVSVAVVMACLVTLTSWSGAVAAAAAMSIGRLLANAYLTREVRALKSSPSA